MKIYFQTVLTLQCFYFRHEAERLEQEAKGRLERQKITDEAEAERARKELLELQAQSAAVESTGQAKAEAQSRAEAARIEGEAAVQQAKLKAEAAKIEAVSLHHYYNNYCLAIYVRFISTVCSLAKYCITTVFFSFKQFVDKWFVDKFLSIVLCEYLPSCTMKF